MLEFVLLRIYFGGRVMFFEFGVGEYEVWFNFESNKLMNFVNVNFYSCIFRFYF